MPANKNAETRYKILDRLLANRYHHYSTEYLLKHVNDELRFGLESIGGLWELKIFCQFKIYS